MGIKQDFPKKHIVQKNRGSPLSNSAKRFFKCLAKHKGNHFEKIVFQEKFFQELRLEKVFPSRMKAFQSENGEEWNLNQGLYSRKPGMDLECIPKTRKGAFLVSQ